MQTGHIHSISQLFEHSEVAADHIRGEEEVVVASHVDADGLCSAAIACTALVRCAIQPNPMFFKQLDRQALQRIADQGVNLVLFTDLGSGILDAISSCGIRAVIADHHVPRGSFKPLAHVNPHLCGADGATQLSGSGAAFLIARSLAIRDGANDDLASLAVVGAVGDLQDMASGRLTGINREILEIGRKAEVLSFGPDLRFFGKQTRPVFKMLEYSDDPYFPGLSGDEDACIAFLKETGLRLGGERWRRWIDLSAEEKARTVSALIRRGLRSGLSSSQLERLVGESYTLILEREGTELRDASEYSTLLNATARYGHSGIGLQVCMGDRDIAFEEARSLLNQHRQNLVNGLNLVKTEGLIALSNIQYFDAGDRILDTIIGIIAGMSFHMADRSRPILAFATTAQGSLKVSARGTRDLVTAGLNLAEAMSSCSRAVGGEGGGHNVAAGATIPTIEKQRFLELLDSAIGAQLSKGVH